MFEGWGEYYLLTGSAAAALIGLLFVVVTLTAGRPRSTVLPGEVLYMTPVLLHFALVVVLSATALAPIVDSVGFGVICGALSLVGLTVSARVTFGIRHMPMDPPPHWSDVWWYGVAPGAIYLPLGVVSAAFLMGNDNGIAVVAVATTALLLVSIRNAWDLVTWIAPDPD